MFNLFKCLGELSKKDYLFLEKLSLEDKKEVQPFIIARWLTGTSDENQLLRLNEYVNPYLFSLGSEKSLQIKLLASGCTGKNKFYNWIKAPGVKKSSKLRTNVLKEFYNSSTREVQFYDIKNEDIIKYAEELGWDEIQIKNLKKELK